MKFHVVQSGEYLSSIAEQYQVSPSQIQADNQLEDPSHLVTGQTLVIRFPKNTYMVQLNDTLDSISEHSGASIRQLYRNNPILDGVPDIYPGQTLVLSYGHSPKNTIISNSYAYPFIASDLLQSQLPFLTFLSPFTYGIQEDGSLVALDDTPLLEMARLVGTGGLMHLSTLTPNGTFSNELASLILNDLPLQQTLIEQVLQTILSQGYHGLDVDFEFVFPQDAEPYANFIQRLHDRLAPFGFPVIVALAPKTSANQPGLLYEGHDYRLLGAAADYLLLMTYEWGYTYGPPMAVSPLPNVISVIEYALTEIPAEKLWLGVPTYGYDWPLPYEKGVTRATSISPQQAIALARTYDQDIQYDQRSQSPWFRYTDQFNVEHEVWFEDAISNQRKLDLINEYGFSGVGYWNSMRDFPQNWLNLDANFQITEIY